MADGQIGEPMTDDQVVSLLRSQGHGVLSLGAEDRGYGVPVSYAYDDDAERVVLEFVNVGESKKQAFAEAAEEVTLTVYTYQDAEAWESVVLTGTLHPIDETAVADRSAARFFAQADDVAGDLRWTEAEGVERRWYEIRQTEATGRHGGTLPHEERRGLLRFSRFERGGIE